ncbi:HupE/UreJ family protein [Umezawaea sp. Da 62-37]|uniref:HupE/UreJ family protein n=1 Tax=Umezawaea sp. Da 62-37 TaxID=3075927 RepID=UPI0028F747C4|nr:HupE/UreJ family protein [Umezawaea sp. Da 62-37]WNV89586.1 HupE/UreJ family protein [Umezawaea sp. Da 62-37]
MRHATTRPRTGGRQRRAHRLVLVLGLLAALFLAGAQQASAHPLSTSAVLLDLDTDHVTATVELPLDQLDVALERTCTADTVLEPATLAGLRSHVRAHMSATDADGRTWTTAVTGGAVETVDGVEHLVLDATLTPATGAVGDFTLHYDAVVDRLISHRAFVSARQGRTGDYTMLVMLSWQRQSVPVASAAAEASGGFLSAVHLGVEHISGGSDHLLFLVMLLLPAPLLARRRRWTGSDDLRGSVKGVVRVISAFTAGHSITLGLAAFGLVSLSTRLDESMIALSVLVSAVHAVRPLVPRGETWIAAGFGLVHGLAFAALLSDPGLTTGSVLTNLLGFNLGIELTRLVVVALLMPSLLLLARTPAYPFARVAIAGTGVVLAAAWLAERTTLLSTNPLGAVADVLVERPFLLAGGLAAFACLARLVAGRKRIAFPARAREEAEAMR